MFWTGICVTDFLNCSFDGKLIFEVACFISLVHCFPVGGWGQGGGGWGGHGRAYILQWT